MTPLVSVMMPVFNGAAFLSNAIESVLAQEMRDLELVISDNVSTDATPDIAQQYARQDGRIKYVRNTLHVSACENINLCYRRSNPRSRYTALLASDDSWMPNFLVNILNVAESYPEATFIYSDMYRTDADGRILNKYSEQFAYNPPTGLHQSARELFFGSCINIMATLVNRELREQIYPTDEFFDPTLKWTPDYHLWFQLLMRGGYAYYLDEPLAYYRRHANAMTMPKNTLPRLREEVIIFRDKLAGVCPPELEDARREALLVRLAQLGFELLRTGNANAARRVLREAHELRVEPRLDLTVARTISALPCSTELRARLWKIADSTSQAFRRAG